MLPEKKASCMRTHSDEADHHSSVIMSAYEIVSFGKTKKKKKKKKNKTFSSI